MSVPATAVPHRIGGALFSYGFRPFFLSAALWAAVAVVLWTGAMAGSWALPPGVNPFAWHVREMVFGYTGGVLAGFLLTAIANWTGRPPIAGLALICLWALWALGRLVGLLPAALGDATVAAIDSVFLLALAAVAWREVLAAGNRRNLPVCGLVTLFAAANIVCHIEILARGFADFGPRLGIAVLALLIALIGGRIVPNFTRNALVKRGQARLPAAFDRFDAVCLAGTAVALALWVVRPADAATGAALLIAGAANGARLLRWQGVRIAGDPLVLVLHLGFLWLVAGLVLLGLDRLVPGGLPLNTLHALTAGAIGTMTLAVMTRASLGHTGRPLVAGPATTLIYVLVILGSALRVMAPVLPFGYGTAIAVASTVWTAAFVGFVVVYGPMLVRGRVDRPGGG